MTDINRNLNISARVTPEFLHAVDEWRRAQPSNPSFSDALRALVQDGLVSNERIHGYIAEQLKARRDAFRRAK